MKKFLDMKEREKIKKVKPHYEGLSSDQKAAIAMHMGKDKRTIYNWFNDMNPMLTHSLFVSKLEELTGQKIEL